MCVISSLKVSSLKLCVCVWVCTHVQGEFRRGIRWNLKWVFLTGPPAVWSQDTCVPCLPPYFLCKWEFLQYMMDGCLGEWMDSKQSRYSLGLHTVTAGRCSHSSSFLQFSDPPNPLAILYLGSLGSQMDPYFCHRNKCQQFCSHWKLSQYSPPLHGQEGEGFLPIWSCYMPRWLPWLVSRLSETFLAYMLVTFTKRVERGGT